MGKRKTELDKFKLRFEFHHSFKEVREMVKKRLKRRKRK